MLELLIVINCVLLITFLGMVYYFFRKFPKIETTIKIGVEDKVMGLVEEIQIERDSLETKLDEYVDLLSTTKDSISKNIEAFVAMLDDVEKKEGYFDVDVIKQVVKANQMLKTRMIDIYEDFVKKATKNKYER